MPQPVKSRDNEDSKTQAARVVIGVGASAGGLIAFTDLLHPLPEDSGLAFVLIQHLERTHPSSLAEIVGASTVLRVEEASDGVLIERNHAYVIPPQSDLSIIDGRLRLETRSGKSSAHFPIDRFFQSLAANFGPQAVGVILSGSGSDGTQGLLSIKEAGGITFAQQEKSAEFGAMPHSAIAAGCVDFVLEPGEIATELLKLRDVVEAAGSADRSRLDLIPENEGALKRIFAQLMKATSTDFTHYKRKTVNRRIARRMAVNKLSTVAEYARFLEDTPPEVATLFREILINVTSFFREPASFEQLVTHWRSKLKDRQPGEPVRAWVAACATGEEAYSLAICLMELLGNSDYNCPINIFGTDINEAALDAARAAVYPEAIVNDISHERLQRFFTKVDRGYKVNKSIRECCVFARHDLTKDPPFSRLDLVCCRNVLIYMSPLLQKRIVPMFHYSLKPGGFLMLGSAEALAGNSDLFGVLDKYNKLFVRRARTVRFTPELETNRVLPETLVQANRDVSQNLEALASQTIRDRFATDGVIVNRDMRIVLFRGRTGPYMDPAAGNPSFHLMRMVREDIAFKLEEMVTRCIQQNTPVQDRNISLERDGTTLKLSVEVIPLRGTGGEESYYLITFTQLDPELPSQANSSSGSEGRRVQELEHELAEARGLLRAMSEEHEVHLEELRAANEEIQSTNEELQSTNEELGTAKEELQSTNEELSTVNQELRTNNSSLAILNDDLKNLFNAANLPIVMVDGNLRVKRFTPAAESFLKLIPADIGRSITDLRMTLDMPQLKELLEKTLSELMVSSITLKATNDRWQTVTLRPYRTMENRIDGAVITFTDIDSLKRSLGEAQDAREYVESILDTLWEPLLILDSELRVQRATSGFYRSFQVSKEETEGRLFYELGSRQWDIRRLRILIEDILPRNTSFTDFEVEQSFPKIGFRSMRLNGRRIRRRGDGGEAILIAIEDVTERREAAEVRYRRLFEAAKDGILELDGDSGDILAANPYFLQICNCSRTELIGKKLWETGMFENAPQLRDLVTETRRKDAVRLESVAIRARDGKRLEVEMVCNRYLVLDEAVIQCNLRDVTERKRAEDELRRSNEDLQQFAYAASHDLQEPLRMVGAYTQLLSKKYHSVVDDEGTKYLEVVKASVYRMEQLIRDLLLYSQTSGLETSPTPVNAENVLGITILNLQLAISDTGAIITNDLLPIIRMDQMQLVQIFQNLISNAIKYRKPGVPPRIHVSADRQGDEWIFKVKDNGLGFNEQYAAQIFGVFKRLHGKDYPGTGIGLSICKKIIERGGGKIWAKSAVGEGSTFYFSIPIDGAGR